MIKWFIPFSKFKPKRSITLVPGEIEDYDFMESAKQIYIILSVLESCNLVPFMPYDSAKDVLICISELVSEIDFNSDQHQISEKDHIRVEYSDELMSLEVFMGV